MKGALGGNGGRDMIYLTPTIEAPPLVISGQRISAHGAPLAASRILVPI